MMVAVVRAPIHTYAKHEHFPVARPSYVEGNYFIRGLFLFYSFVNNMLNVRKIGANNLTATAVVYYSVLNMAIVQSLKKATDRREL